MMSKPNRQPTPRQLQGMRALSVRQPFASLIVAGRKVIEFRSWSTMIRGPILIYAALARPSRDDEADAAAEFGLSPDSVERLPRGVLVGQVEIVDCRPDWLEGFAWELRRPVQFKRPIAVPPGRQPTPGFWIPFPSRK